MSAAGRDAAEDEGFLLGALRPLRRDGRDARSGSRNRFFGLAHMFGFGSVRRRKFAVINRRGGTSGSSPAVLVSRETMAPKALLFLIWVRIPHGSEVLSGFRKNFLKNFWKRG